MNRIQNIVADVLSSALSAAIQGLTSYEYEVPSDGESNTVHVEQMNQILASLRELLPDSRVVHTLLAQGSDGKLYDIATMDDRILGLVDSALNSSYIVVDWS